MAESRGELEVYNQWFAAADLDRDGVVSGPEAVQFFQRSGLPQNPTLFKVWQYVAGDRPALSRQEFYTAMKLVSLAQLNGGVLDDQQALRLVNGLGGPVPLPRMQGLAIPRGIDLPPQLLPPQPGGTAAAPPPPSATGVAVPAHQQVPPRVPSPTRQPVAAGAPSPARAGYPAAGGAAAFPPLSAEQAAAFQTAFGQLDTDRDGFVQGTDCFGAFMQSGLPKTALKQIWDLVAGDEPRLNRHQFVQALYLIDCVKRGMPVPAALPPGPFPPVAGTVSIGTMMGGPADIYSASLSIPDMVPRQTYQPQPVAPLPFASQVPGLPQERLAALDAADRMRLEAEREAALKAEAEQRKAEEERAAAAAKREFFTRTLGDLRLTQSKVTRAVVEAQQRCEMERAAADQMEADYNRAYAEFSMKHAQSQPLVEALKKIQEEKAALTQKLESLRAMVQQLEDFDPEWETREKGECEALNLEIADLTVKKEQLQRQADSTERKRDAMVKQTTALKEASAGVEAELATLKEQVDKVAADGGKDKDAVVGLLKKVAPLYNRLYDAAKAAMVPLPAEAVVTMKREASPFQYDELLTAAAGDWGSFKDEGFKIVSALPVDTRLTTFAAPSTAALEKDEEQAVAVAPAAEGSTPAGAAAAAAGAAASSADPAVPGAAEADAAAAPAAAEAEGGAGDTAKEGAELSKAQSTAEQEAVSAAAEAGVLASAIAEALASAPAKPASRQTSLSKGEGQAAAAPGQAVTAAEAAAATEAPVPAAAAGGASNPFEVSFENGTAEAPAAAAVPAAAADAFAAFDAPALSPATSDAAAAAAAAPPPPPVKQASGAFGSSQTLAAADSPKDGAAAAPAPAAAAPAEEAQGAEAGRADVPAPAAGGSWTAF